MSFFIRPFASREQSTLTSESGADVDRELGMSSLVSVVLWNVVQVLSADDDRSAHLGRHDLSGQDTATNGDESGPWALLVCKSAAK